MSTQEKSNFINNNIGQSALNAMQNNINAVYADPNVENDANNRAANKLGPSTIKYNNGATPIMFNGIRLL